MEQLRLEDPNLAAWWAMPVEATSALAMKDRLQPGGYYLTTVAPDLSKLVSQALLVPPSDAILVGAVRLVGVYPLRAADALQLAAFLTLCQGDPSRLEFVCLDARLSDAARAEGATVLPIS